MLKHSDNETEPTILAAKVRVTPAELADALAVLQARKDGDLGTISLGEAVQELNLDATPDEVLKVVQARRDQMQGEQANSRRKKKRTRRLVLAAAVVALLPTLRVLEVSYYNHATRSAAMTQAASGMRHSIALDPNLLVGESSGKVVMLSEVGDNQPVHCTLDGSSGGFGPYSPSSDATFWTLIKHDGRVYVRGRIQSLSPKVLARDGTAVISPSPDVTSDGVVLPITMPVDGFDAEAISTLGFHAQNIHLDKHAYEKW